jgi:histidine ammonia-lyase
MLRKNVYGWLRADRGKRLMFCEEKVRLLDAYATATDRQAEAVKALSADAAKGNRAAFRKTLAHAEQTRQDAEEARLALHLQSKAHGC